MKETPRLRSQEVVKFDQGVYGHMSSAIDLTSTYASVHVHRLAGDIYHAGAPLASDAAPWSLLNREIPSDFKPCIRIGDEDFAPSV